MNTKKMFASIIVTALFITGGASATVAWLIHSPDALVNNFEIGKVNNQVTESFTGHVKSNVSVKNTGNIPTYMRAAVLPNWCDEESIVAKAVMDCDYEIDYNTRDWFYNDADGFYYYKYPVEPGQYTTPLINRCTVKTKNDYQFRMDILSSSIQADPKRAVQETWKVEVNGNGQLLEGGGER
jgi:hypothetical protein